MQTAQAELPKAARLRVAVAGIGAIGGAVARALAQDAIPGVVLAAIAGRTPERARAQRDALGISATILPLGALAEAADIVVECAPAALLDDIIRPVLLAGRQALVLSVGALLDAPELLAMAQRGQGRILVPSGALLGLDAVAAAAEGQIHSVRMITRKPVAGLLGAPYLVERGIDISGITRPMKLFSGTARQAARGFPANLNVAVALSLAGIGPEQTRLEIWADPKLQFNTHRIVLRSDSANLDMKIANIPSANPKTGRITALSVLALLRKQVARVRIGT